MNMQFISSLEARKSIFHSKPLVKYTFFRFTRWNSIHSKNLNILYIYLIWKHFFICFTILTQGVKVKKMNFKFPLSHFICQQYGLDCHFVSTSKAWHRSYCLRATCNTWQKIIVAFLLPVSIFAMWKEYLQITLNFTTNPCVKMW